MYLVLGKLVARQNDLAAMQVPVVQDNESLDSVDSIDEEIR